MNPRFIRVLAFTALIACSISSLESHARSWPFQEKQQQRIREFLQKTKHVSDALKNPVQDVAIGSRSPLQNNEAVLLPVQPDPSSPEDHFDPRFNPEAKVFELWTGDVLSAQYQEMAIRTDLTEKIDLQMLLDFNVQAAGLWAKMSECSAGDAEAARTAYFKADFECLGSESNQGILKELRELHQNVLSFLKTTDLAETLTIHRIQTHPLLAQVIEEIVAVWFPTEPTHGEIRKWAKANIASPESLRTATNLMNLLPLLPRSASTPVGLWPAATAPMHAYYVAKFTYFGTQYLSYSSPLENYFDLKYREVAINVPVAFALEYLNPMSYVAKLPRLIRELRENGQDVELSGRDPKRWKTARALVETTRGIAKKYGITRKAILK